MRLFEPFTQLLFEFRILFEVPSKRVFLWPDMKFLWEFLNKLLLPIIEFMFEFRNALFLPPIVFPWEFDKVFLMPRMLLKCESLRIFPLPKILFLLERLRALEFPRMELKSELRSMLFLPQMTLLGMMSEMERVTSARMRKYFMEQILMKKRTIYSAFKRLFNINKGIINYSMKIIFFKPTNPKEITKERNQLYFISQFYKIIYKMNKKVQTNRVTILEKHIQQQLLRQQTLNNYYQKMLKQMATRKETLQSYDSNNNQYINANVNANLSNKNCQNDINRNDSFMGKSNMSLLIQTPKNKAKNKINQQSSAKKQLITFQAEYQSCSEQLAKVISSIIDKQKGSQARRQYQKVNKTSSSVFYKTTSKISQISKRSGLPSKEKQLRTQSSCPQLSKKQKIMLDIGDISALTGQDEVVNTLINNIKSEQEKLVDLILKSTQKNVKGKMKNYMQRQTQKYEEMTFKMKQEENDKILSSLKSNKETVKYGYNQMMKEVVDRGLRSRGFSQ